MNFPHPLKKQNFLGDLVQSGRAFSLVEVALSLGVFSFAIVALLGTLPLGLSSLQDSTTNTITSHIYRGIAVEARQANFSALETTLATPGDDVIWYDVEGFGAEQDESRQVFAVRIRVTDPGTVTTPSAEAVRLPVASGGAPAANSKIKKISIEIHRGTPLANGANRVGTTVFHVGDNGR